MSRYANSEPERWDYMNPTSKRSYRSDTIEPTESAREWAAKLIDTTGGRECRVCGELTVGTVFGDPLCVRCEADMVAGA